MKSMVVCNYSLCFLYKYVTFVNDYVNNSDITDQRILGFMVQVMLFISYAIIAAAIMVVPPRMMGVGVDVANLASIIFFVVANQLTQVILNKAASKDADVRLDVLENITKSFRSDLAQLKEKMGEGTPGAGDNKKIVSELKMLQTLLGQVMTKEKDITSTEPKTNAKPQPRVAAKVPAMEPPVGEEVSLKSPAKNIPAAKGAAIPMAKGAKGVKPPAAPVAKGAKSESAKPKAGRSAAAIVRDMHAKDGSKVRRIGSEDELLKVMRSSLAENRVDLYLQPIVGLPSRKAMHFECFSRMRDENGDVVLPRDYMDLAEKMGLMGTLDNLLLFRLIQLVRKMGRRRPKTRFFCNMSRFSLNDSEFFPQFSDFMLSNNEFKGRLVFELSQADYNQLGSSVINMLAKMGREGFSFSMDQIEDMDFDIDTLSADNFKYLKVDMAILSKAYSSHKLPDYVAELRRKGITLISSHIEEEAHVLQAVEGRIEYAQGYLFGEPMSAQDLDKDL